MSDKVKFTEEQQAVIDARKCNILVSAAAGSGKTAVLVERIIRMIENDLDIDHLLVVTFTKAAALQMKEKINIAIQKSLLENPENKHLQKQETLIHNAQITTIDSFCQYVVKNNFNNIGIDPNFRVGDEGELKLLRDEVMQNLLEEEYTLAKEGKNEDFLFCMNYFASGRNDKKVEEYIYQLHKFAMSMPWPKDWIAERAGDYDIQGKNFDSLPWVKDCMEIAGNRVKEALGKLTAAEKLCCDSDGPYMYGDMIQNDIDRVGALLKCENYDAFYDAVRLISYDTLSRKSDASVNPDKKELVKNLRNGVKEIVNKLPDSYFVIPSEMVAEQMKHCDRAVKELCRLTMRFLELFDENKREKLLIDFSDMEHMALEILVNHPGEEECKGLSCDEILQKCTPSAVALEYRDFYKEVLIDEYQDSNNVQEMILKSISGDMPGVSERFMVGDVKQSIYKFRLARPELFMDKLENYSRDAGAELRRIDLHKNFRSRKEVLEITNYIFDKIMGKDLGKVDYDQDARLVTGAKYEEPLMDVTPELILLDAASDMAELADYSAREKEALVVSGRIHQLMEENKALQYKDIVILLRSRSGWEDVFKRVLESQRIPAYIESKDGYFDAPEVAIMLDLMTIIDNPSQDIPLVSVMHSEIGGFSDEELARLKIAVDNTEKTGLSDSFYYGLLELAGGACEDLLGEELGDKLKKFVAFIDNLREKSVYTPVHELIQYIFMETGFDSYCLALPGGNQRKANLDLLLNKALAFEKSSFKGIFHFVRYMENIKIVQVDYGEAGTIDENANVVRIMSIHKSKGLEFPVVFVSGLSKEFNQKDASKELITDMDLGIGVKYIGFEERIKSDTLKRLVISDRMIADSLGEELRVLYVALTRAKEKLIMTAAIKKPADEIGKFVNEIPSIAESDKVLPFLLRRNAKCYLDLVLWSVIRHPAFGQMLDELQIGKDIYEAYVDKNPDIPSFKATFLGDEKIVSMVLLKDIHDELKQMALKEAILNLSEPGCVDEDMEQRLSVKFTGKYAYEYLKGLYTKTTVTELKKHMLEEMGEVFGHDASFVVEAENPDQDGETPEQEIIAGADEIPDETPKEKKGKKLTGAERGTAYHRIMEILDDRIYGDEKFMASPDYKRIYAWMCEKSENKVIPEEYKNSVWAPDVETFLKTELGQRMGQAFRRGELMREKPFMMGISARELKDSFPEDEMILIQGIIDAWFLEGDDIVLMDYKTDRVSDSAELIKRYRIQLDYYKRALEAATKKKVKEVYIYSFALGEDILVN